MPAQPAQEPEYLNRQWGLTHVLKSRWRTLLIGGALVAPVIGLSIAAVVACMIPREHLGRVRLQIQPVAQRYNAYLDSNTRPMPVPTFIETQFQIIRSKSTLYPVIEKLQLVQRWKAAQSSAEAYAMLSRMMEIEKVQGTDLIDIKIYHADRQESTDLANAIAQAYRMRCIETAVSRNNNACDMLNAQETLQQQKVEDARQRMIELMEKLEIVDLRSGLPAWAAVSDFTEVSSKQIVMQRPPNSLQAEQELSALQTQIATFEGLSGNRLIEEAALNVIDSTISTLFPNRSKLKVSADALLNTGLGPRHPDVVAVRLQNEEIDRLLAKGVQAVKESLRARLEIATKSLETIRAVEKNEKNGTSTQEHRSYSQYVEAKRAYETQSLILTDMRRALEKERVSLSLPGIPIQIHELAEPNPTPEKPDVLRLLMIGLLAGGAVLFPPVGIASMYIVHGLLRP